MTKLCTDCRAEAKWCKLCERAKPLSAFRLPNGRPTPYCYECLLAQQRETYATAAGRGMHYRWHLRRKFGISKEEAARLEAIRECEVCGLSVASYEEAREKLHVDHCHERGIVRGVLCRRCNYALSVLEGDREWLAALAAYLKRH